MKNNDNRKLSSTDITERLFFENEIKSNILGTKAMLVLTLLTLAFGTLVIFGVIDADFKWTGYIQLGCCILNLAMFAVIKRIGYDDRITKYHILAALIYISGVTYFIYPLSTVFIAFGPIMVSIKYYDPKLTLKITLVTWITFILAVAANIVLEYTSLEVHNLHVSQGMFLWTDIGYTALYYVAPRTVIYMLEAFIGYRIANAGRKLVKDQAASITEAAIMSLELSTAAKIQEKALATKEFCTPDGNMIIHGEIKCARDIGGDFYDHFMINDHLQVVVVADVSDKGLPAAMFAIEAQSYLRFAFSESFNMDNDDKVEFIDLEKAMNAVNRQLSKNNMDGMFVTMWIGCFDTRTGVGKYINAGHNLPYIRHKDGSVEVVDNEPQVFLAAFEDANIKANTLRLRNGDTLIIYTDGVTDARNENDETFGTERLEESIRNVVVDEDEDAAYIIRNTLSGAIEEYAGNQPRYDDITVMTVYFKGESHSRKESIKLMTGDECASIAIDFINSILTDFKCVDEKRRDIDVVVDEICTNISMYAYDGEVGPLEVLVHAGANYTSIRFIDEGMKFNPLETDDPDVSGEPQIGGLGIYLVKNLVDSVDYKYVDGNNVFTVYDIWNM